SMVILIKKGDLAPGTYTVKVQNPAPADCGSLEPITVVVNPPPKITDVIPKTICQGGGSLDIKGTGFQPMAKVKLGSADASSMTTVSPMEIMATFSGGSAMFQPK